MGVAIYARQSVLKEDSLSIETQIEACRHQIAIKFPDAHATVFEDRGYSGKNMNRPQLQELLQQVEENKIEKIVIYKLDRISRNIADFYNLHSFLINHNCSLVCCKEGFDTDSELGTILISILIGFAQSERENISLRVKDSYYMRAQTDGRWLGGKTPFGFDLSKTSDKISTLVPNENADIVSTLFYKYAYDTSCSLHKLVEHLHKNYGIAKTATAVNNILSNPIYVEADAKLYNYYKALGVTFLNNKEEWNGEHSCLILNKTDQRGDKKLPKPSSEWQIYITNWKGWVDSRTFLLCQERMSQNVALSKDNSPKGAFQELSGLVKCAKCGRAVKIKGKYGSMSCSGRSEMRGLCDSSFKGVRLEGLQEQVASEIQYYLDHYKENHNAWLAKKAQLKADEQKIEQEIDNLVLQMADNPSISKRIAKSIEKLEQKLSEIQYQLQMDVSTGDKIEYRVLKILERVNPPHDLLKTVKYEALDKDSKQSILRILIDKILLNEDGTISIQYNKGVVRP